MVKNKKNKYICPNCGKEHKTPQDAYVCMINDIDAEIDDEYI